MIFFEDQVGVEVDRERGDDLHARERERERENASVPLFFLLRVCKAIGFFDYGTKNALRIKKRIVFFTSKAHPAVIKNDMVK